MITDRNVHKEGKDITTLRFLFLCIGANTYVPITPPLASIGLHIQIFHLLSELEVAEIGLRNRLEQ